MHIGLSELGLACCLALYEPFSPDAADGATVVWTTIIGGFVAMQTALAAKRYYTTALAAGAFAMMLLGTTAAFLGAVYGHACRFAVQRRDGKTYGHTAATV